MLCRTKKLLLIFFLLFFLYSCVSSTQYIRPDDVNLESLDDDKVSDYDIQLLVEPILNSLIKSPAFYSETKPVIALTHIVNNTMEHFNTDMIAEEIMTILTNEEYAFFVERQQLQKLIDEQRMTLSGLVDENSGSVIGKLQGVQYYLFGKITSIEKESFSKSQTYYRLAMKLVDVNTGNVIWSDKSTIKKMKTKGIGDYLK